VRHRPRRARRLVAAVLGALALSALPSAHAAADECDVPGNLERIGVNLPHLAARLHAKQPVTIVAIGGGSSSGAAAGSPDLSYPSRLRAALATLYPLSAITVVNKAVPRETAWQMVERFRSDAIAQDPVLVIWELGTVEAVRGTKLDDFVGAALRGIEMLKESAIDIILVDMQFSQSTATMIDFEGYLAALRRVGELDGVYVFPRYDMMRYWSEQNMFNFDRADPAERAKLAARVYDCLGRHLAHAIRLAVQ
jgi:hypothetical protein